MGDGSVVALGPWEAESSSADDQLPIRRGGETVERSSAAKRTREGRTKLVRKEEEASEKAEQSLEAEGSF